MASVAGGSDLKSMIIENCEFITCKNDYISVVISKDPQSDEYRAYATRSYNNNFRGVLLTSDAADSGRKVLESLFRKSCESIHNFVQVNGFAHPPDMKGFDIDVDDDDDDDGDDASTVTSNPSTDDEGSDNERQKHPAFSPAQFFDSGRPVSFPVVSKTSRQSRPRKSSAKALQQPRSFPPKPFPGPPPKGFQMEPGMFRLPGGPGSGWPNNQLPPPPPPPHPAPPANPPRLPLQQPHSSQIGPAQQRQYAPPMPFDTLKAPLVPGASQSRASGSPPFSGGPSSRVYDVRLTLHGAFINGEQRILGSSRPSLGALKSTATNYVRSHASMPIDGNLRAVVRQAFFNDESYDMTTYRDDDLTKLFTVLSLGSIPRFEIDIEHIRLGEMPRP